jgi:flavin-binding protein dodecin
MDHLARLLAPLYTGREGDGEGRLVEPALEGRELKFGLAAGSGTAATRGRTRGPAPCYPVGNKEVAMADKVFKKIRVVGCSKESFKHAIELAVEKAGQSVHGMAWFEVVEMRGAIADGKVAEWQATLDVALKVD